MSVSGISFDASVNFILICQFYTFCRFRVDINKMTKRCIAVIDALYHIEKQADITEVAVVVWCKQLLPYTVHSRT